MMAILGGGTGGISLATYFQEKGIDVTVWNRTYSRIKPIIDENNEVLIKDYENKMEKGIKIKKLTSDLKDTIQNNEIFFITTPGTAHTDIAQNIKQYINENMIIILNPGRTYGCVAFKKGLGSKKNLVRCYENQTLLHACRITDNILEIFGKKTEILYSTLDNKDSKDISMLSKIFPEMRYIDNYYSVTLNNIGAMFHPIPSILNISRIENQEKYNHYSQGISPKIATYIENVDKERKTLCEKLGSDFISVSNWLKREYNTFGSNLYENLKTNEPYYSIEGPKSISHRYIYDDILTGLVPLYKTGIDNNVEMEYTKTFLEFASLVMDYDFIKKGRDAI